MKTYLIPLILILISCNKTIKDEFRATVIAYQEEFPVPENTKENDTNRIYLYHVYFFPSNGDTSFNIHRTYSNIENGLYEGQKIYQDREMKPLVINDIFNVSGDMTDEAIKNQHYSLWDSGSGEDEQHTPLYWYKVKNQKIHFWKKTYYTAKKWFDSK